MFQTEIFLNLILQMFNLSTSLIYLKNIWNLKICEIDKNLFLKTHYLLRNKKMQNSFHG